MPITLIVIAQILFPRTWGAAQLLLELNEQNSSLFPCPEYLSLLVLLLGSLPLSSTVHTRRMEQRSYCGQLPASCSTASIMLTEPQKQKSSSCSDSRLLLLLLEEMRDSSVNTNQWILLLFLQLLLLLLLLLLLTTTCHGANIIIGSRTNGEPSDVL